MLSRSAALSGAVIFAILILRGLPVHAQAALRLHGSSVIATPNTQSETQTFSANVREVNVLFSASDWRGRFVSDLRASDLMVFDNGRQLDSFTYFLHEQNLPLQLVILVDVSASVTDVFRAQQQAATLFLQETLRANDKAALMTFGSDTRVVQDFTPDLLMLRSSIAGLRATAMGTAVYDALRAACEQLAKAQQAGHNRRALVLITDGDDNSSKSRIDDAIATALRSDVVIFALNTNPQVEVTDRWLKKVTDSTGGTLLHAAGKTALRSAFRKLNQQLRSQYSLGYRPPNLQEDGSFHRIHLSARKFGLRIQCRKGYYVLD